VNTSLLDDLDLESRMAGDRHRTGYPFVTVSRQAGAGGHSLAEAIREKTNLQSYQDVFNDWRVLDREICEEIAAVHEFHISMKSLLSEEYHSEFEEFIKGLAGQGDQYAVYKKIFWMIRTLAKVGKVILVGRAANFATAGQSRGIHIRLVAPSPIRIERMMKLLDVNRREASKMVESQDRDRARLAKAFFDKDINDASLYDVVWNTEERPIDQLAEEVVKMIKQKAVEIGYA
jgi:cytidylate kinase